MAKLAPFVIAAVLGATLGIVGVIATVGALSPSAEHVAEQATTDPATQVYGTR